MTDQRLGGIALIAGTLGMLVTMAFHPTAHDFAPGAADAGARMIAVHWLAIATLPLSFLGALALTRRTAHRLAVAALAVFCLALIAGLVAATISLAVPALARQMADEPAARLIFRHDAALIQAFGRVIVVAMSAAIALWSAAGRLPRSLAIYGIAAGVLAIAALASGQIRMDAHGFGLVVLAQAIWMVGAGIDLWRA